MVDFTWHKRVHRRSLSWVLLPVGANPENYAAPCLAIVRRHAVSGKWSRWCAEYGMCPGTLRLSGVNQTGWALLGSTRSARAWVERRLAQSWEEPTITNPVT